jgi:hypothetical protein
LALSIIFHFRYDSIIGCVGEKSTGLWLCPWMALWGDRIARKGEDASFIPSRLKLPANFFAGAVFDQRTQQFGCDLLAHEHLPLHSA